MCDQDHLAEGKGLRQRPRRSWLSPSRWRALAFLLVGGISVTLDIAVLYMLHDLADIELRLAIVIGQTSGLLVNFWLNRLIFRGTFESRLNRHVFRYAVMVGLNYLATLLIVPAVASIDVSYIIAKLFTVSLMSLVNFQAYRRWVFV